LLPSSLQAGFRRQESIDGASAPRGKLVGRAWLPLLSGFPNGARAQLPHGLPAQEKRWVPRGDWVPKGALRLRGSHLPVKDYCNCRGFASPSDAHSTVRLRGSHLPVKDGAKARRPSRGRNPARSAKRPKTPAAAAACGLRRPLPPYSKTAPLHTALPQRQSPLLVRLVNRKRPKSQHCALWWVVLGA
jgi:hypothetical protein